MAQTNQMNVGNARDPEQARRMKLLNEKGLCYLCKHGTTEDRNLPITKTEGNLWYVMQNDFPLPGTNHHYMFVPRRHVLFEHELTNEEFAEYRDLLANLVKELNLAGYSTFTRNGDGNITGATIPHTHIHLIVGGLKPPCETLEDVLRAAVPVIIAFKKQ